MDIDPAVSLRIINNQRLMRATHRGEYRDLGGALALTSDAPSPFWNCLEAFNAKEHAVESLLDIGFSLLRMWDRLPAVRITPLDRPKVLTKRLQRRGLAPGETEMSMVFRGDASVIEPAADVTITVAGPDDAATFATVETQARGIGAKWARPFLLGAALANIIDADRTFYLAHVDGEPAGTALVVRDGICAGIYSVATLKSQRRRGVATSLMRRAITDALAAGADLICLETVTGSDAMRLYERLGFAPAHESTLWTGRS